MKRGRPGSLRQEGNPSNSPLLIRIMKEYDCMEVALQESILAIVTLDKDKVLAGGAPVFLAKDEDEQQQLSLYLSRILKGMAHDLENGVMIIVKH